MATSSKPLAELVAKIASNTAIFEDYLATHNLPAPSFDKDAPLLLDLPGDILEARETVLDATQELQVLIAGPVGNIRLQTHSHTNMIALHAIYRFEIAKSFPIDGEATFTEISKTCGLNEADLRRILRYAMTKHIFKEPRKGVVVHTAASRVLAEGPLVHDWMGMLCEEMWPSATRAVDALVKWKGSQEPKHSGFSISHNTEDALFTEMLKYPERAERFGNAMTLFGSEKGFEHHHIADAFSWDSVDLFVDVGGSYGDVSIALAQKVPSVRCVVQDLPEVVTGGASRLPQDLQGRVTFEVHDFFTDQPMKGADVYHLRWILHDYSDLYCIKILRSLVPALKKGSRVIVAEFVIPPPGIVSTYQENMIRSFDLAMLEMNNAKEREADDWLELFETADKNFQFIDIKRPEHSKLCFIEFEWKGADQ